MPKADDPFEYSELAGGGAGGPGFVVHAIGDGLGTVPPPTPLSWSTRVLAWFGLMRIPGGGASFTHPITKNTWAPALESHDSYKAGVRRGLQISIERLEALDREYAR